MSSPPDLDINWVLGYTCNPPFDQLCTYERLVLAEFYHCVDRHKAHQKLRRVLPQILEKLRDYLERRNE